MQASRSMSRFPEWDFFGYISYPTATVVAALAHTFSFKGMGEALTEFAGTYARHPSLQTGLGGSSICILEFWHFFEPSVWIFKNYFGFIIEQVINNS